MLTDRTIKNAKYEDQSTKNMFDGGGLYLKLTAQGSKLWRMKYRYKGKEKLLSFGKYPEVSLAEARQRRDEARRLVANGVDPGEMKKAQKGAEKAQATNSFEVVARTWYAFEKERSGWSVRHAQRTIRQLELWIFPWIGEKQVTEISITEVHGVLKRIEDEGKYETREKTQNSLGQIFRYAERKKLITYNPIPALAGEFKKVKTMHFASIIEPLKVGELLRAIDAFSGTFVVHTALQLLPLVFTRPGELRHAKWEEINLEKAEWKYLVTKTETEHLVPLSTQAVQLLRELRPLTGNEKYVFPGRSSATPISDATINAALQRLGYDTKKEITGHGFRAMARTLLAEELHQKPEVIEHQLAHAVPDALGTAYNRTKFIKERKAMMQLWADYLDKLKVGADVIDFQSHTA